MAKEGKEVKKEYESPTLEFVEFGEDVITTSGGLGKGAVANGDHGWTDLW